MKARTPNAETRAAIEACESGDVTRFDSVDALLADAQADHGELVANLRKAQWVDPDILGITLEEIHEAADRLILYREALEVLLLVKDAVDYRGDACHPAEMVGAVLDKCILERIDAVLSSDRKVAGGSGSA